MRFLKRFNSKRQAVRSSVLGVEALETKALMATTSTAAIATGFTAPDLTPYVHQAQYHGRNTSSAIIRTMENALQQQITQNALVALEAGTLIPTDFQTSVNNITNDFNVNSGSQLLPRYSNLNTLLTGRSNAIQGQIAVLNSELAAGLITQTQYTTEAGQAVNTITGGPIYALHTPRSGFVAATNQLTTHLNLLPPTLATGATTSLTLAQAQTIAQSDALAYETAVDASLLRRPTIRSEVNAAITNFETSVNGISSTSTTSTQQQLASAITVLDNALLDTTGIFGPRGSFRKRTL